MVCAIRAEQGCLSLFAAILPHIGFASKVGNGFTLPGDVRLLLHFSLFLQPV